MFLLLDKSTEVARTIDVMMVQTKIIYILMTKEIKNMFFLCLYLTIRL